MKTVLKEELEKTIRSLSDYDLRYLNSAGAILQRTLANNSKALELKTLPFIFIDNCIISEIDRRGL